jgi:hypothetical protein
LEGSGPTGLRPFFMPLFTEVHGRGQPVEKVGVGQAGGARERKNKSKTLQKTAYSSPEPRAGEGEKEFFNRLGSSPKFAQTEF